MAFDWSPYRAVLFDVDGTIAETDALAVDNRRLRTTADRHGGL